jgi:hypothetical protein
MKRILAVGLLCLSACASAPGHKPAARPVAKAPRLIDPGRSSLTIGKADLELARALLNKSRSELSPGQWTLLDEKLTAAERAWERLDALKHPSARSTEAPPAAALVGVGAEVVEGASLAPLLILLVGVWSASTAGPDRDPPPWHRAVADYDARLHELSEASRQVELEIEASRGGRRKVEARAPASPRVEVFVEAYVPVTGEPPWRPCTFNGTGGPGASSPRPEEAWIECRYQCGKYAVRLYISSRRSEDCQSRKNLDRAEDLAKGANR